MQWNLAQFTAWQKVEWDRREPGTLRLFPCVKILGVAERRLSAPQTAQAAAVEE